VDTVVTAVGAAGELSPLQLSQAVGAQYWGPGRFRAAVRSAVASGRIRRLGRNRLAAAKPVADLRSAGRDRAQYKKRLG
jgi:hypothetical protein